VIDGEALPDIQLGYLMSLLKGARKVHPTADASGVT
jgi:hypothetical protein